MCFYLQVWKVYQYASSFAGKNFLHVNGQLWGRTSQTKSDAPTAGGLVRADKRPGSWSDPGVRSMGLGEL